MASSTPTRIKPGLVIPDKKSLDNDIASAVTYLGLYTPPQSAHESPHESRRGSIHSSWTDSLYCAGTSGYACSDPVTPVHRLLGSHDNLIHGLSDTELPSASAAIRRLDDHIIDSDFHIQASHAPTIHGYALYTNSPQHVGTDPFSLRFATGSPPAEAWPRSMQSTNISSTQTTCLGSETFPIAKGFSPDNAFLGQTFSHMESSLHGFEVNMDVTSDRSSCGAGNAQANVYHGHQYPQVIVPSQVSPQDPYDHSQFDDCSDLDHGSSSMASNFGCGTLDSFESFGSPSPLEPWRDLVVEDVDLEMKMLLATSRRLRPTRANRTAATSKKRPSKRVRGDRKPWHRHQTAGIEVQCEGKQFRIDKPIKYEAGDARKPHVCNELKSDGTPCQARFERSEHLKRHKGSHITPEHRSYRPYTCPAERCEADNKRFSRSDNACDHFRTHLKPHKKGKRNDHIEWEWLHHAIRETYEDKAKAQRVLNNLTTWVHNHPEELSG